MTLATSSLFAFDLKAVARPEPQKLIGESLMIEHVEWLQMTVGPFLTLARSSQTGMIEFLLEGSFNPAGENVEAAIARESEALEAALKRVGAALDELIGETKRDQEVSVATTLLSLRMLLAVNLPDPTNEDALHLCGDRLQLTHWGLTKGVPLGRIIAQMKIRPSSEYVQTLRLTLTRKYGANQDSVQAKSVSSSDISGSPVKLAIKSRLFPWARPKDPYAGISSLSSRDEMSKVTPVPTRGRPLLSFAYLLLCLVLGLGLGGLIENGIGFIDISGEKVRAIWKWMRPSKPQPSEATSGEQPNDKKQ